MKKKIATRAILMAALLAISITCYADFAAHEQLDSDWIETPQNRTVCHRKYNNGSALNIIINWDTSTVIVNDVYTKIDGILGDGAGISTTEFTTRSGTRARFRIYYTQGYPVIFEMIVADAYQLYADGYGRNRILDSAYVSCPQSFITPFREYMYSERE